jgi:hypothetical protein
MPDSGPGRVIYLGRLAALRMVSRRPFRSFCSATRAGDRANPAAACSIRLRRVKHLRARVPWHRGFPRSEQPPQLIGCWHLTSLIKVPHVSGVPQMYNFIRPVYGVAAGILRSPCPCLREQPLRQGLSPSTSPTCPGVVRGLVAEKLGGLKKPRVSARIKTYSRK